MDRDTGRSKGFGFVEMQNDQDAQAAIAGVNGKEHDGRTLTVNEARPAKIRSGGGGGTAAVVAADAVTIKADGGLLTIALGFAKKNFMHCRA